MKLFVDSNIIIEGLKLKGLKEAGEILKFISKDFKNEYYFNNVVYSEVKYKFVFKLKNKINIDIIDYIFDSMIYLNVPYECLKLSDKYIKIYNLKPNDALILATCKHYNIPYLLSLDEDFKEACEKEGITLIDSVEKLKEVF